MQEAMQILGTLVTIAGLVVVAPYEAGRVLPDLGQAIARGGRRLRGWLAQWLPCLRRSATINVGRLAAATSVAKCAMFGRQTLVAEGSTEEQVASIRAAVTSIYAELDGLRDADRAMQLEFTAELNQLRKDHVELREVVSDLRRESRELNARGFPLAAVGALLAGMPGAWISGAGWWLSVPLMFVGGVAACVAARWLVQSWPQVRDGLFAYRTQAEG